MAVSTTPLPPRLPSVSVAFPLASESPRSSCATPGVVACVCAGDNDPLDVLEIGEQVARVGEVYPVKVLGALGMMDGGGDGEEFEMDWKIIAVRASDPLAAVINGGCPVPCHTHAGSLVWVHRAHSPRRYPRAVAWAPQTCRKRMTRCFNASKS